MVGRGFPSGQRGGTQDPVAQASEGSNPSPRTFLLVKYINSSISCQSNVMVKKRELKKRAIYVYPPSDVSEKWKKTAEESGGSISKFVIEHVENSLNRDVEGFSSRSTILEENKHLRETLRDKDKRVAHLELLVEKLEEDLRLYRSKTFTDKVFTGVRSYDRKLVEILRESGAHSTEELLSRLRIKENETEAMKAISRQLENLEAYGLARSTMKGWIWKE